MINVELHRYATAIQAISLRVGQLAEDRLSEDEFDIDSLSIDWRIATDEQLFESMSACVFFAGMKTRVVALKWLAIRKCFCDFEIERTSRLELSAVISYPGIIRHSKKCQAIIDNAKRIIEIRKQYGSFVSYLRRFHEEGIDRLLAVIQSDFSHMGPATSRDWVKEIGLDTFKPDVHLTRILKRLGLQFNGMEELKTIVEQLATATGYTQKQIDRILFQYGSGHKLRYAVCGTTPLCGDCLVRQCAHANRD